MVSFKQPSVVHNPVFCSNKLYSRICFLIRTEVFPVRPWDPKGPSFRLLSPLGDALDVSLHRWLDSLLLTPCFSLQREKFCRTRATTANFRWRLVLGVGDYPLKFQAHPQV